MELGSSGGQALNPQANDATAARRARQQALGLFIQSEVPHTQPTENRDDVMQTAENSENTTRAKMVVDHLSAPPSFKEVAAHELKKAAIWAPILLTTLASAIWMNKRLVLKAVTKL